jgi:hypothetical protein
MSRSQGAAPVGKWKFVAAALAVVLTCPLASADEVATIVNDSDSNIELYLKWSHVPNESQKIILRPGDSYRTQAPSGKRLDMRFNSTPGLNPPAEVRLRVRTAEVDAGAGYKSTFKQKNPKVVVLTGD